MSNDSEVVPQKVRFSVMKVAIRAVAGGASGADCVRKVRKETKAGLRESVAAYNAPRHK